MRPAYRALLSRPVIQPAQLGSNLVAGWDAERADLITISTGVSSWKDIVAGYDAVQATGSAQPSWSATSFGGGAYAGVTFDGADDNLTSTDAGLLAALPSGSASCEIWTVFQQDAPGSDANVRAVTGYGGNGSVTRSIRRSAPSGANRASSIASSGNFPGTIIDLSLRHLVRTQVYGSILAQTIDGYGDGAVDTSLPATVNTRLRIGASSANVVSQFWQGQIAVVLVTQPLTDGVAAALHAYLMKRRRI